jgi:hypothetical protein
MSNDIRDILSRLTALEGKITPVNVKHGLNKQQDSVPQLPALFKPKHISVLGAKKDPTHPMAGYAVGADESAESKGTALAEAMAEIEEDMLSKVKKDLTTYLDRLEQKVKADPELLDKAVDDVEDANPAKAGKQHSHNSSDEVDEDATETDELARDAIDNQLESVAVKTVECWPGTLFEIHGNEQDGFEVRYSGRSLPSRFKNIDDADMAIKLFKAHRDRNDSSADYVEER